MSQAPHLPRKEQVDVTKCRACHAKRKWMSPSATPARQSASGRHQVPRLPRNSAAASRATKGPQARHQTQPSPITVTPENTKRRWVSPSATPATQSASGRHQVPRLPRKSAVASRATKGPQARHQTQPSPISATATQNEGGCHQVPHLPRKVQVDVAKCRACHEKQTWGASENLEQIQRTDSHFSFICHSYGPCPDVQ